MPSSTCHLPNGQTFSVTPVFGGVNFKSNDMNIHHSVFPPGWTIVIHTEKPTGEDSDTTSSPTPNADDNTPKGESPQDTPQSSSSTKRGDGDRETKIYRFTKPTLRNDHLFISAIVNPPSSDFKPASSPTRQIAMMLWASLWWYFHEPQPNLHLLTEASAMTPESGRPKGDWRVNIKREGIFRGRNLLQKLERMGMIASEDSSVGLDASGSQNSPGWDNMFTSRRSFWQLDPRIFLFTLPPAGNRPPSPSLSPHHSRSSSPCHGTMDGTPLSPTSEPVVHTQGPFTSGSHLPTYFPPPVTQYTFTNGTRHPIRPKPPRQGEVFYTRYIPSVDQYLSFRVPMLSTPKPAAHHHAASNSSSLSGASVQSRTPNVPSDLETLHTWMNDPRVNAAWGMAGPHSVQEEFLREGLTSRHSFPVFGCWDGKPFGYFEIYWVKEDKLGNLLGGNVDNYDRGLHVLVGEQEFRGPHRVTVWLSALVHYCWLADMRTQTVMLEPRVDNQNFIDHLHKAGFYKEGEVAFPHKQSAVMKIKRDAWEAPAL